MKRLKFSGFCSSDRQQVSRDICHTTFTTYYSSPGLRYREVDLSAAGYNKYPFQRNWQRADHSASFHVSMRAWQSGYFFLKKQERKFPNWLCYTLKRNRNIQVFYGLQNYGTKLETRIIRLMTKCCSSMMSWRVGGFSLPWQLEKTLLNRFFMMAGLVLCGQIYGMQECLVSRSLSCFHLLKESQEVFGLPKKWISFLISRCLLKVLSNHIFCWKP